MTGNRVWKILLLVAALASAAVLLVNCVGTSLIGNMSNQKIAAILPGKIDDNDYNQLAYETGKSMDREYGYQVDYFEDTTVPKLTNLVKDLSEQKYTIIWVHGSQFDAQVYQLAAKYPRISFIMEGDIQPDLLPDNVWFIDRNYQEGMYVLGRLAAEKTETGKVGYICGLSLPFSYIEIHAIEQAIADSGKPIELIPVWAGDFNDPAAAKVSTAELLDAGADVVISSLNLGTVGLAEEIESRSTDTWFTGKYKSKEELSPEHFLASLEFNFSIPFNEIINSITRGERSGYYGMNFGQGLSITQPVHNATPELNNLVSSWMADVASGKIVVTKDSSPLETTIPAKTP
jgi:basic membrane protein A and related proteins